MAEFTLDDAHEALAGIHHILIARENARMSDQDVTLAWALAADACHAIEAQLPEPCPECGSDECGRPPIGDRFPYHCPEGSDRLGVSRITGPW